MKYVYIIRYWNLGELEEISDLVDCAVVLDESQIIPAIKNLKEEAFEKEAIRNFDEDEELHANCCGRDSIEEKKNRLDLKAGFLQKSIFLK